MLSFFEAFLLGGLILTALATAFAKRLLSAVIIFTSFSLIMSVLWVIIKSPDLAITEASVGAGITSLLFYLTLKNVNEIKNIGKNQPKRKIKISFVKIVYILFSVCFIIFLLVTVSFLPAQGSPESPHLNEIAQRFIESGVKETGVINIVAAMILDYRAFDTFGEAAMLFTATMGVVLLLKKDKENTNEKVSKGR